MQLETRHFDAFAKAESLIQPGFLTYLELKELLPDASPEARGRFRSIFARYYGLNGRGLTAEFKDRFFEILFLDNVIVNGRPDIATILTDLHQIKRGQGNRSMQFSFVSKLVNIRCESSPIFDRHVANFFSEYAPAAYIDAARRVEWFVDFLSRVGADYQTWAKDERMEAVLNKLRGRDPRLGKCHVVRLIDFLIWNIGDLKLLAS